MTDPLGGGPPGDRSGGGPRDGPGTSDRTDPAAAGRSSEGHEAAFHELYALPDPDSARYVVIASGHGGGLVHVGTFDAAELDGSPPADGSPDGPGAPLTDGGAPASPPGRREGGPGER